MSKRITIKTIAQARAYLSTQGLFESLTVKGDMVIRSAACGRCGGSGNGGWFQDGGVCYECGGANTTNRVISTGLVEYAREERRREMAQARKCRAAEERAEAKLERQRMWCEANGYGRLTFDEKNAVVAARREADRAAAAVTSHHIGNVGKREVFELELVHTAGWENAYGYVNLYIFRDVATGQAVTWQTSSYVDVPQDLIWDPGQPTEWHQETTRPVSKGDVLAIKGTVKEHVEYKGVAQTKLARCKIERVVAESSGEQPHGWLDAAAA